MQDTYFLHTALALWSLAVGAFLCFVYDIFRLFRLCRKQNNVLLFFSDLAFCAVAAVSMLLLFFNLSYGRMRAYSFVLVPIGFLLWRFTAGRLVFALMQRIVSFVQKLSSSVKMRISAVSVGIMRRIYTSFYCRTTLKKAKSGFGLITKRKEFKNETENTDTH